MSTPERPGSGRRAVRALCGLGSALALAATLALPPAPSAAAPAQAAGAWLPAASAPRLGQPVPPAIADRSTLNVFPDGRGLPPGRGDARRGADLYAQQCARCHGAGGRGGSAEELAGGTEALTSATPDKTIGLYWPYATTLFDFIRRSKPMDAPGALSADDVYALTAYLLQVNGVIDATTVLDAARLRAVRMPNRDGFVGIDAGVPPKRPGR